MKIFTLITICCLPQTIFGGLWGMNTNVPMMNIENYWPYFGIIIVSSTISVVFVLYFKNYKY